MRKYLAGMRVPWLYVAAPLPALVIGGWVIAVHGGTGRLLVNLGVAIVGSAATLAAGAVSRSRHPRPRHGHSSWLTWGAVAAISAVAVTLVLPGDDGVHRWAGAFGVQLHPSLLLSPWILVIVHRLLLSARWRPAILAILALQTVHVLQPDAAQATAVAAAITVLSLSRRIPLDVRRRAMLASGAFVPGVLAWFRPDPLAGVVDVERVVQTAFSQHLLLGWAAALSACILAAPFALQSRRRASGGVVETSAAVLGVYVVTALVSTAVGEFPVLVLGYGASTVLAYYSAASAGVLTSRGDPGIADTPSSTPQPTSNGR